MAVENIPVVFMWILMVYGLLTLLMYFSRYVMFDKLWKRKLLPIVTAKEHRVLIVIAHPDDEVMFFGPTILGLLKVGTVYVLCLSQGSAERKNELWASCQALGIKSEHITLLKHDKLRDSMHLHWPVNHLAAIILNHVQANQIKTVVTFDEYGVSGHVNHIAANKAVVQLQEMDKLPGDCRVFVLDSVNIVRKYLTSLFDIPLSYCCSSYVYLVTGHHRSIIATAMEHHQSQLVWYRRLYLIFSRYLLLNTLVEIPAIKSEKDQRASRDSPWISSAAGTESDTDSYVDSESESGVETSDSYIESSSDSFSDTDTD